MRGSESWREQLNGLGGKGEGDTLVGLKVPMTSEVFWVSCGPPGGGGGTTRGPAILRTLTQRRFQEHYCEYMPRMLRIDKVFSLRMAGLRQLDVVENRKRSSLQATQIRYVLQKP